MSRTLTAQLQWPRHIASLTATLRHIATHCSTLQHTDASQHTVAHCKTLQHKYRNVTSSPATDHIDSLTATRCNALRRTAAHCSKMQHTAAHCSTLQHTAAHCSTLQHTTAHSSKCHELSQLTRNGPVISLCSEDYGLHRDQPSDHPPPHGCCVTGEAHTTAHYSILQHTATHCNTPQVAATHCNVLKLL